MPGVSHSRVLSCARTDRETEHSVAKGRRSERERQQSGEEYCQYGEYRRIPWYEQFSSLSLSPSLFFFSYPIFLCYSPTVRDILPVSIYRSTAFPVSIPTANVNIGDGV